MVTPPPIRPWAIWWANLDPQVGREQAGRRPVVIVGTQLACELLNDLVIVAPLTTTDRGWPFQPAVTLNGRHSVVMADQVKSISTKRLLNPHPAQLTADEIDGIRFALRRMIDV